jgi:hypothetical protein
LSRYEPICPENGCLRSMAILTGSNGVFATNAIFEILAERGSSLIA